MTSSTDVRPLTYRTLDDGGDLRVGNWTRLGGSQVVGDAVTELALEELTARAKVAAEAQGYAAGWAQGMQAAHASYEAERVERDAAAAAFRDSLQAAQDASSEHLASTAAAVRDAVHAAVAETNAAAVQLAFDIVETLLARELSVATDPGADAIARVLDLAKGQQILELRMCPTDIAATDTTALTDAGVTVVPDSTLNSGDAIADTGSSVLDASIRSAVDRLREAWNL